MAARSNPPFHAEHIGSLLRPDELRRAFRAFSAGELSADAFAEDQNRCIREALAMQEDVGLQGITDGEFRRTSYWSHFVDAVDGLGVAPARFRFRDDTGEEMEFLSPHVDGPVRRTRSYSTGELQFLLAVTDRTPKLTMPSPPTMHFWAGSKFVDNGIYPSEEAYFEDLIKVFRDEIADLAAAGCNRLHVGIESLDDNILTYFKKSSRFKHIEKFCRLCEKYGITILAYFIIGTPLDTPEYLRDLPGRIEDLGIRLPYFNVLSALAETPYYDELLANGTFSIDHWGKFSANPVKDFVMPSVRSDDEDFELRATVDQYVARFKHKEMPVFVT